MKILVTGSAGYLGSVLCPQLEEAGHEVRRVDNFFCDPKWTRGEARGIDVSDRKALAPLYAKADVVIPLAFVVGAPACDKYPDLAERTAWAAGDIPQSIPTIYPMTNSGYGLGGEEECTEESPLNPISLYGRLKAEVERTWMRRPNAISLRFATLFGPSPRMRDDLLVNDFVRRAVHDRAIVVYEPDFRRNFLHVKDAARAFLHCIDNFGAMRGEVYNVGLAEHRTKGELALLVASRVRGTEVFEGEGSDPDRRDYRVSTAKMAATGFWPQHPLAGGICGLRNFYSGLPRFARGNV